MATTTNAMRGAAALLGSEAKVRVLQALRDADHQRLSQLVRTCGMSKTAIANATRRLDDAGVIMLSAEAGETVVSLCPEAREMVGHIVSLDRLHSRIYPVPGRPLTDTELDHVGEALALRMPVVARASTWNEEELALPLTDVDWATGVE